MSAAPRYKVYSPTGEYIAACKYAEDAAVLVAAYSAGAQIRNSHARKHTLWTEGEDGCAGASYDRVAATVHARERQL